MIFKLHKAHLTDLNSTLNILKYATLIATFSKMAYEIFNTKTSQYKYYTRDSLKLKTQVNIMFLFEAGFTSSLFCKFFNIFSKFSKKYHTSFSSPEIIH